LPPSKQPIELRAAYVSTPTLSVPNARAMDTTITGAPTRPRADSVPPHIPHEITPVPLLLVVYAARVPNSPTSQVLEAGPGWPVLVMAMTGPD